MSAAEIKNTLYYEKNGLIQKLTEKYQMSCNLFAKLHYIWFQSLTSFDLVTALMVVISIYFIYF